MRAVFVLAIDDRSLRRLFVTSATGSGLDAKVIAGLQGHRDGGKLIFQPERRVVTPLSALISPYGGGGGPQPRRLRQAALVARCQSAGHDLSRESSAGMLRGR